MVLFHNAQLLQDLLNRTLQARHRRCNDAYNLFQSSQHGWLDCSLHDIAFAEVVEGGHLDACDCSGKQTERHENADENLFSCAAMKSSH